MGDNFFNENVLDAGNRDITSVDDFTNIKYHIKKADAFIQFYCEAGEERLNSSDISNLLKKNESTNFLNHSDFSILSYLMHRLGTVGTIYRVMGDVSFIFTHLKDSAFEIYFNEEKITFSKGKYKIDFNLHFDEDSNIVLEHKDNGEFIFGQERCYFHLGNEIHELSEEIPLSFYREISLGNNKFSIETFFTLKKNILEKIKLNHNLSVSGEIENLSQLNVEKKTAKIVLEIGRTSHFIILEFKYKVGKELFPVGDYVYAETINWLDKKNSIKIVKEKDSLVEYVPDTSMSSEAFKDLFDGTRIFANPSQKSPFLIMLPISNLDNFVKQVMPKAEEIYEVIYKDGQKLELTNTNVRFELETNLNSRLNIFEFSVKFKIGDEYFDLEFLKDLMLKNKKFVQMKDGTTMNVENIREINKWIEFLDKYEFKKKDNSYKTQSHTALELDEFLKNIKDKDVKSNDEYKNIILELKEKNPISEIKIPDSISQVLRSYQIEGVYWLYFLQKYGFGGVLADEMGLGKTIQALTILAMNKDDGPHLVVCPKSLIYNWENEVKKYFPELKVLVVDKDSEKRAELIGKANEYNIVITSYSMLQKDYRHYIEKNISFNYEVLDEAHYVKNMKTLSAKAVRVVPSRRMILLTGTPLENNLEELYGTFDLVMPNYLGSMLEFKREFVSKIERNNTIALEILQAKIRPFILRRTKKEVLKELPDKQEQIVYNEMTNKQVAIYNEVLNRVKADINTLIETQGFNKSRIQILSALLKLRQVCNHPSLIDKSFKNEIGISGKYEQFLELLEEVIESGEKVLVFSQFTSMLDIFENHLERSKINYLRLDGSTKNRQEVVDQFQNDENVRVFLISLKAGGVGLNLTAASAVFLYDPWWNPMAEQQAVDRTHRIGQRKTVNIYKFITKNSIEEKILKLQERKENMFENLVMEDNGFIRKLEWEDLMELFE